MRKPPVLPTLGLALAMAGWGLTAAAQIVPAGRKLRISGDTELFGSPVVAVDAAGRSLVVWGVGEEGPTGCCVWRIFGRFYDAAGQPVSPPQAIDGGAAEFQENPDVTAAGRNRFLVVWSRWERDSRPRFRDFDVFGQLLSADGQPLGPRFPVNDRTPFWQVNPAAAASRNGDLFVVWGTGYSSVLAWPHVLGGHRFRSDGTPAGEELQVNSPTVHPADYWAYRSSVAVAADPDGESVVVWASESRIFARRYDRAGRPRGPEARVDTSAGRQSSEPAVAADANGNFVVLWTSSSISSPSDIRARGFDRDGPAGPESRISGNLGETPAVTCDSAGRFVATWTVKGTRSPWRVALRQLAPDGTPRGGMRIAGNGFASNLAAGPDGDVLVVWVEQSSPRPDSRIEISGRHFRVE